MLAWLALACGGDGGKGGDAAGTTADTASATTPTGDEGCLRRCNRGAEGAGCDAAAIGDACDRYCVDPPPLPDSCDDAFRRYESCVAPVRDFTCDGSDTVLDGVTFPETVDPYECLVEAVELEPPCLALADPACTPTIGGVGATCTADLAACSADGVTFDASMICDGTVCSMLVDGGAQVLWPRADLLCAELEERAADRAELATFLVLLATTEP